MLHLVWFLFLAAGACFLTGATLQFLDDTRIRSVIAGIGFAIAILWFGCAIVPEKKPVLILLIVIPALATPLGARAEIAIASWIERRREEKNIGPEEYSVPESSVSGGNFV